MATRLYFQATTAAPISPAYDAAWLSTAEGVRRNLIQSKETATETVAGTLTGSTNDQTLAVQAISPPLSGNQTVSGTWTFMVRGRELDALDNVNRRVRGAWVVTNDGSSIRGTLVAHATSGSTSEYATTLQGVQFANAGAVTTVNALDGDRIVVELGPGSNTTGTTPQWEIVLGGTGTDHANANADTTGTVPWVEFSVNLVFNIKASATAATGTGVANSATVQVAPHAEAATGTGTAYDATVKISPHAEAATGTGTANDATVTISGGTNASAEAAAGTGTAYAATTLISPTASAVAGTGTANNPTAAVSPHAEAAAGTGTAYDATVRISPHAEVATGTGTANDATALTGTVATATAAAGTGVANNATTKVSPTATAATGTGTAHTAAASVAPTAGAASGTGVANDAHTQVAPSAGVAAGTGAAFDATVRISPSAGVATGTGTSNDATVSFAAAVSAHAEAATGTGIAFDATVLAVNAPVQVGSWYGLSSIMREAAEFVQAERVRGPVACPNDGEPLQAGPGGGLFCPFDGWTPSGSYVGG